MRNLLHLGILGLFAALTVPLASGAETVNLRNGFNLRCDRHETIGATTRLYTGSEPGAGYVDVPTAQIDSFEAITDLPPTHEAASLGQQDIKTLVNSASDRTQVDADLIASIIRAESGDNAKAVSRKGAQGLMQLMPGTASRLGVRNSFDPAENIDGGVRYFRELLLRYDNDIVKALAAYNAGPQRVQQYKGVPPYRETHAYVARVVNDYNRKKLAQRKLAKASVSRLSASTKSVNATAHAAVAENMTAVAGSE